MSTAVVSKDPQPIKAIDTPDSVTPMQMIRIAVEQGADMDKLDRLMSLQERWEANEAKKAFVVAMTAFKSETIEILKDKQVRFTTTKGTTEYKHATLHSAVTAAAPMLSKHGLSHRWKTAQSENALVTVTCIITHHLGHFEETTLSAPPDNSGGKNSIQAIASTVAYLERYTFMAATGLTSKDMDDDGHGATQIETISEEQAADLRAKIEEVGCGVDAFLKIAKVDRLEDIATNRYAAAMSWLNNFAKHSGGQ